VELIEIDALHAQALQAPLARLAQVRRAATSLPHIAGGTDESALGRDHEPGWIGVQRLGDQTLAHIRSVGVGRIDEVDAELQCPAQHATRALRILRFAPDSRTCQPHRTEAEAIDAQVAAEGEGAGGRGRGGCIVHRESPSFVLSMWRVPKRLINGKRSGSHIQCNTCY